MSGKKTHKQLAAEITRHIHTWDVSYIYLWTWKDATGHDVSVRADLQSTDRLITD